MIINDRDLIQIRAFYVLKKQKTAKTGLVIAVLHKYSILLNTKYR